MISRIYCILTAHLWNKWVNVGSCKSVRDCTRCNIKESKTDHNWGSWEQENECIQYRICLNCCKKELETNHSWSVWNGSSKQCTKCNDTESCSHNNADGAGYSCGGQEWVEYKCPDCGAEWNEP